METAEAIDRAAAARWAEVAGEWARVHNYEATAAAFWAAAAECGDASAARS